MAHEVAKLLLEHAGSFLERTEAVKSAAGLGMPLAEIEEYLDGLDVAKGPPARRETGRAPRRAEPKRKHPQGAPLDWEAPAAPPTAQ